MKNFIPGKGRFWSTGVSNADFAPRNDQGCGGSPTNVPLALYGNLSRCNGYEGIVRAVRITALELSGHPQGDEGDLRRRLSAFVQRRTLGDEEKGNGVHAVPYVLWGEPLAFEDVPEMPPAPSALDLGPFSIRVRKTADGSRDLIIKARPAATRIEFALGAVQRGPALAAHVGPRGVVILVLSRKRGFRPLLKDHPLFEGSELSKLRRSGDHWMPP